MKQTIDWSIDWYANTKTQWKVISDSLTYYTDTISKKQIQCIQ